MSNFVNENLTSKKNDNKMRTFKKWIFIFIIMVITISCQSLVYSPSSNVPDEINKDSTNIIIAYEKLPLTSEDEMGNISNDGLIFVLQHSFSNKFLLNAKYFADINSMKSGILFKHGFSLNAYYRISDSNSIYKYYLTPSLGTSLEENSIMMGVLGISTSVQTPKFYFFEPFFSFGIFFGNTFYNQNYNLGNRFFTGRNNGMALISNIGSYISLYGNSKLYLEISVPILYNFEFENWSYYLTPTIGFKLGL